MIGSGNAAVMSHLHCCTAISIAHFPIWHRLIKSTVPRRAVFSSIIKSTRYTFKNEIRTIVEHFETAPIRSSILFVFWLLIWSRFRSISPEFRFRKKNDSLLFRLKTKQVQKAKQNKTVVERRPKRKCDDLSSPREREKRREKEKTKNNRATKRHPSVALVFFSFFFFFFFKEFLNFAILQCGGGNSPPILVVFFLH